MSDEIATEEPQNVTVDSCLKELNAAVENSEGLSYDDVMNEMNVAYKAIGIISSAGYNEEKKAELSKQVSEIMVTLGDIAKIKKTEAEEKDKIKQQQKKKSKSASESEPVKEKQIPKPVFDEYPVETKVVSSTPVVEPTKEELLTGFKQEDTTKQINNVQINIEANPSPENKEEKKPYRTITPEPEKIEVVEPKESINSVSKKEEPFQEMEIETPVDNEENIIVPEDKNDDEKDDDDVSSYDFLISKPFEGDEDDESSPEMEQNLDNVEFVDAKDDSREREIAEEFSAVPEGMEMHNIKTISRKKVSETMKALQDVKTSGLNLDKINMFDFDGNDNVIRREYLKTRNDMISNPKISRIALLMSGHYEEITSYGNYDLVSIVRLLNNPDANFVDKEMTMLNSIYEHIKYVSYSQVKPSFEEWAKNIMYPDMASLYFGVYDANSVGENSYSYQCPYCHNIASTERKNKDLTVAVPKELTKEKLEGFITCKDVMKLENDEFSRKAKNTTVRIQLPHSKIIVDFAIPSLLDYIVVLNTAQRISDRDLSGTLDLSAIDLYQSEGKEEDTTRILAYLYIKDIGIPAKVEGSNKFRYIRLNNKADIIEHVNGLDLEDYNALFEKQEVQNLLVRTSTRYYLENVECTSDECKKKNNKIKYINLDPKQIFFFKIGEEKNKLMI